MGMLEGDPERKTRQFQTLSILLNLIAMSRSYNEPENYIDQSMQRSGCGTILFILFLIAALSTIVAVQYYCITHNQPTP